MSFQPKEEKDAERQLITYFSEKISGKIIKLQDDDDNGKTDGIVEYDGKEISVEARRKGFPNHSGKTLSFVDGWKTRFLVNDGGIFINESTVRNHKDKGFVYLVEIKGSKPRACVIDELRISELLNQPNRRMRSTNSGSVQSVKTVPLNWFKEL